MLPRKTNQSKTLNYRIGIQKRLIQESIISLKDKLRKKKKLLKSKKELVEKQFVNVPSKEVELARYQRLFNISEKYYRFTARKKDGIQNIQGWIRLKK